MSLRAALAALWVAAGFAGCATPPVAVPAPVEVAPVVVRPAPTPAPAPAPAPLIEYPPLEPVALPPEPPAEQTARSAPAAAASEPAPVTMPPPASEPVAEPAPSPPPEPTEEQQLAALLSDLQRYAGLGPEDVRRETNAATQLLARQRTDINRIRLAVLYTLAKSAPQDDQRALQLLELVAKGNPGTPAVKQFAAVLHAQVAERVRAVRDEQQKAEAAVKKLEALRLMERDLLRDRIRSGGGGGGGGSSGGGGGGGGGG